MKVINSKQTRLIRHYKKTNEELFVAKAAIQNCAFAGNVRICASFAAYRMNIMKFPLITKNTVTVEY